MFISVAVACCSPAYTRIHEGITNIMTNQESEWAGSKGLDPPENLVQLGVGPSLVLLRKILLLMRVLCPVSSAHDIPSGFGISANVNPGSHD